MPFPTFGGNESSLALFARPSLVHSFDVKQVVFIWLQENLLLAAADARDRPVSVWNGPGMSQMSTRINNLPQKALPEPLSLQLVLAAVL